MITVEPSARMNSTPYDESLDPCVLVIFGASGDLTRRKLMPALFTAYRRGELPAAVRIVGYARSEKTDAQFKEGLRDWLASHDKDGDFDESAWDDFAETLSYCRGAYDEAVGYAGLREHLLSLDEKYATAGNRIFYLATPPSVYPLALEQLRAGGLVTSPDAESWTRVVIEKPFGHDLASAIALNKQVKQTLDESQAYRIDHYLGKETVQNILVFRFANAMFEPLWNRNHIDHVQITAAESIGVGSRAGFYDQAGVLRDFVQNHILEVLALCAMEQPVSFEADPIRDEKVKLLRSLRPMHESEVADLVIPAQYEGYQDEDGVADQSRTPTYMAMKIMIDNWRWQGVPFYIRAGKGLKRRATEVSFHFRRIPFCLFGEEEVCQRLAPNVLTLRLQPDEGIDLQFNCKTPGEDTSVSNVMMNFSYDRAFNTPVPDAYERLLIDVMRGDATLFARHDAVERAWKYVQPILTTWENDQDTPLAMYERGSIGPREADRLLYRDGRVWLEPDAVNE